MRKFFSKRIEGIIIGNEYCGFLFDNDGLEIFLHSKPEWSKLKITEENVYQHIGRYTSVTLRYSWSIKCVAKFFSFSDDINKFGFEFDKSQLTCYASCEIVNLMIKNKSIWVHYH